MKPSLLTLLFFLIIQLISAQEFCGTDHRYHSRELQNMDDRIMHRQFGLNAGERDIITIPVVVHIIHNNGTENLSDEAIQLGIEHLNQRFANEGDYYDVTGHNVPFRFCLASVNPDGEPQTGIVRVESSLTNFDVNQNSDLEFKNLSRWEPNLYLNIWLVKDLLGTIFIGYANYPESAGSGEDGVVLEAQFFDTSVLAHEAGHYLGLYHTFNDGCENTNSTLQGDRVSDTPPDATDDGSCQDNSCSTDMDDQSGFNPFTFDVPTLPNYMDYTDCPLSFSQGQSDRMYAAFMEYRSTLLLSNGCGSHPSDIIPTVSIVTSWQCFGTGLEAVGENIIGAAWDYDGDGLVDATGVSIDPVGLPSGLHQITVWAYGYGGSSSSTIDAVTFHAPYYNYPMINGYSGIGYSEIYDEMVFCEGDQLQFFGEPGMVSYQWSTGQTTQNVQFAGGSDPLDISLTAVDSYGNEWFMCYPFHVEVAPPSIAPVLSLPEGSNLCIGSEVSVQIQSSPIAMSSVLVLNGGNVVYPSGDAYPWIVEFGNSFQLVQIDSNGCTTNSNALYFTGLDAVQQGMITQNGNQLSYFYGNHYRWYLDGQPLADSDSMTITADQYGCYTVEAWWITEECTSFSLNEICFEEPQSVFTNSSANTCVYPNPADDETFVGLKGKQTIVVYDITGRRQDALLQVVSGGLRIDTAALPSGLYLLECSDGTRFKLVVEHR